MKDESIHLMLNKLQSFRNKEKVVSVCSGLTQAVGFVLTLFTIAVWFEYLADSSVGVRTVIFWSFFGLSLITSSFLILKPLSGFLLRKKEYLDKTALRIGGHFSEISDSISNAIQLYSMESHDKSLTGSATQQQSVSNTLVAAGIDQNIKPFLDYDFSQLIEYKRLKLGLLVMFIGLTFFYGSSLMVGEDFAFASKRLTNYSTQYIPEHDFDIVIGMIPESVKNNEIVDIDITFTGTIPKQAFLYQKGIEGTYNKTSLTIGRDGYSLFRTTPLTEDYSFYIGIPWYGTEVRSDTLSIKVLNIPSVVELDGVVNSPSYTKIPPLAFNNSNPAILAIRGSTARFKLQSNTPLAAAQIVFVPEDDNKMIDTIELVVSDKSAEGELKLQKNGKYRIALLSEDGLQDQNDGIYDVQVFDDTYPTVKAFYDDNQLQVDDTGIVQIEGIISDDFGFSSLKLFYRLSKSAYTDPDKDFSSLDIIIDKNKINQDILYLWNMNSIGISPSDEYEFYLEVADNDRIAGFKKSKTGIMKARLLSLEELLADSDQKQNDIKEKLKDAVREAEEIKDKMEDLKQELRTDFQKKEMNFEQKKKANDLANKQKKLNQSLDEIKKDISKATDQLKQNNLLSEETLQEYMELQKLMDQLKDPELERMSRKINEELNKLSPQEMRKMLEKSKLNEEQFRESIKRTMERLKRIDMARKADALQKMADDLSREQQELADRTGEQKSEQEQKKDINKQNALQKKLDDLSKKADELKQQASEDSPKALDAFQKAEESLKKEQTSQMMNQAAQQMKNGQNQKAKKNQQQASDNLQEFASQMQQLNKQMSQQSKEQILKDLQKQMQDILELSKKQEALKGDTQKASPQSSNLPDLNKKQGQLKESLRNLARQMQSLSEQTSALSPEMGKKLGEALNEMQGASNQLSERRPSQASQNQQGAMAALNSLAGKMQAAMGQMQQGGQGQGQGSPGGSNPMGNNGQGQGGFGQQLQQAAAQQQMLNQAMQNLQKSGGSQPGGMSNKQKAEYSRLQKGQGDAKKTLDQMIEEEKQAQLPNSEKIKELQDIAKEMEEIINDLESGDVSNNTIEKQNEILTRMLDAIRSENKRDFSKKREGKDGRDYYQNLDQEGLRKLRRRALQEMINRNQRRYKKDYERIIRDYYESMDKNN